VEALIRLEDPRHIAEMTALMSLGMSDEMSSWHLSGDGRWARHVKDADGKELLELQNTLILSNAKKRRKSRRTVISARR
jgi:polyphosphate kinase